MTLRFADRKFQHVKISQIRSIPNRPHDPTLTRSIAAMGQEVPIILGYNGALPHEKPFRIIEGARRTLSMIHLGETDILAEVREDQPMDQSDRMTSDARSTLATNTNRSRNIGAEMMAVRTIMNVNAVVLSPLSRQQMLNTIVEDTGMHMREVKSLASLLDNLTDHAKLALVEGRMTGSVAKRFAKLSYADQDRLTDNSTGGSTTQPKVTIKEVESALRAQRNNQLDALNSIEIPALTPPPNRLAIELDQYAQRLCSEDRCALITAAEVIRRYESNTEESNVTT